MEQIVLYAVVAFGCSSLTHDPVAVVELGENEFALIVADSGLNDLMSDGVDQDELHTGQILAGGIHLDELHPLDVVLNCGDRLIAAAVISINGNGDLLPAGQIAVRGGKFADGVAAVGNLGEAHHAVLIGSSHRETLTEGVEQAEGCTSQGLAVLIDLADDDLIGNIDDSGDRMFRVDESAVNRHFHFHFSGEITRQRLGFHNAVGAEGNLFKSCDTIAVCPGTHDGNAIGGYQTELHASQRILRFIQLFNREAGVIIADGGIAGDNAVCADGEAHGHIVEGITIGSIDLSEGVASGRHRDVGDPAHFIGGIAVDDLTSLVVHLDDGTGQRLFTGDVGLGEGDFGVDQLIVNGVHHQHTQHVFISCLSVRSNGEIKAISGDLPAVRSSKLADIVIAMREGAGQRQHTILVGSSGGNEGICHQCAVGIGHVLCGEQTEDETFTGFIGQDRLHAVLAAGDDVDRFLLLEQGDLRRQEVILRIDADFDQLGLIVLIVKINNVGAIREEVPFGGRNLRYVVLAQGQFLGGVAAIRRGDDGIHQLVRLIPYSAVLAGDVLGSADLKHRTCQIIILVYRRMDFIAPGVSGDLHIRQLQALFIQQDAPHDGIIGNLDFQFVGLTRQIALMANENGKGFCADQIAFRGFDFLDEVQTPGDGFGERNRTSVIRGEGVDDLFAGIVHGLLDVFAVGILQLEAGIGEGDGFACDRIGLDELQPVQDGLVRKRQRRRIDDALAAVDLKGDRAFDLIAFLTLHLFQHIHTIGQRLGHGIAVGISDEVIALDVTGIVIGASLLEIHAELSARFGRFHAGGICCSSTVTQQLDDSLCAVLDFVGDDALIGDDGFLGLLGSVAGIHDDGLGAGLIAGRRRQLHHLIQTGPKLVRGDGRICASRLDGSNDHISLDVDHLALTIRDVLGSKHLELCAGQNAVAASAGSISRIAGVFIHIALVDLQLHQHRLVGGGQLRGFVRMDGCFKEYLFKHISFGCAALLYGVLTLAQRFRHGDAVCIRNHRCGKTLTVLVGVVNIEHHTSNGIAVFTVCLGQTQPALGGFVFHVDFVGAEVFLVDDHLCGEVIVYEMRRNLGFSHLVHAIREQRRHSDAVGVRGDNRDNLAITLAVVGG